MTAEKKPTVEELQATVASQQAHIQQLQQTNATLQHTITYQAMKLAQLEPLLAVQQQSGASA